MAMLVCLFTAPHAAVRPPSVGGAFLPSAASRRAVRIAAIDGGGGAEPPSDEDDVLVLERGSVRDTASSSGFGRSRNGQTQVYGAWLDDDIVGNRGDSGRDALSYGVACMRAGSYSSAVEAFQEAVREAGGEGSMKGGQMCVWLAQALYAAGEPKEAVAMLDRISRGHPGSNVRKAASEIKYILEAPELKLDERNFVQIPEAIMNAEERGRQTGQYAKMEKKPEKHSLEWYMLQKEPKPKKQKVDPAGGVAAAALVGLAVYAAVVTVVTPS